MHDARPDVLTALFELPDWYVVLLLTDPQNRLLYIDGHEPTLYRADDPEDELGAQAMIVVATWG